MELIFKSKNFFIVGYEKKIDTEAKIGKEIQTAVKDKSNIFRYGFYLSLPLNDSLPARF